MRVVASRDTCAGGGMCAYAAPEVFDQDEDEGLVLVLVPQPAPELHESVRQAARGCPTRSIQLTED
jgi:ferredoxin